MQISAVIVRFGLTLNIMMYVMKKILIIISVSLVSLIATAQSYRGMVELGIGVIGGGASYSNELATFKLNNSFLGSFTTSHGCQITPSIFIGAGVGVDIGFWDSFKTPILDSKFNREDFIVDDLRSAVSCWKIPVFLAFRWDLDIQRKVSPFIDLKIGYSINVDRQENYSVEAHSSIRLRDNLDYGEYLDKYGFVPYGSTADSEARSSFYFKPTIGVRIKCKKNCGFNMGVSYEVFQSRLVGDDIYIKRLTRGAWMFNLGFDF